MSLDDCFPIARLGRNCHNLQRFVHLSKGEGKVTNKTKVRQRKSIPTKKSEYHLMWATFGLHFDRAVQSVVSVPWTVKSALRRSNKRNVIPLQHGRFRFVEAMPKHLLKVFAMTISGNK